MDQRSIPKSGEIYIHFKDKLYQIITVATNSETLELMVVYQALYGDFKTFVRPLTMFLSEVDHEKYPEVKQKYRFELRRTQEGQPVTEMAEEIEYQEKAANEAAKITAEIKQNQRPEVTSEIKSKETKLINKEETVNDLLLKFLDAKTYNKKLEILSSNTKHMSDRLINDMAVALDCTVDEGPLDQRIQGLINCLQAMTRFEDRRLR